MEKYFGKYRGQVTDTKDPEARGRLQVVCPAVLGSQPAWALPSLPFAGKDVGLSFTPPVSTLAWVEFEGGDPAKPIVSGFFWAKGERPSAELEEGDCFIQTKDAGLRFQATGVTLTMGGAKLELAQDKATLALDDQGLAVDRDGARLTHSRSDVTVGAGGVVVSAGSQVVGNFGVANVELSAPATLTLKAAAVVDLRGSMVKVNDDGLVVT